MAQENVIRKLAAIIYADVAGYSRQMEAWRSFMAPRVTSAILEAAS